MGEILTIKTSVSAIARVRMMRIPQCDHNMNWLNTKYLREGVSKDILR
jgi:hypothetical protein